MTLVKCKKCKKEISSTAKFCTHCGEPYQKQYCVECGHAMSLNETACSKCGYVVNEQNFYNKPIQEPSKGEKYDLSIVALICSFIVPIVGLVIGLITLNANKGQKNEARTFSMIAVIVSAVELLLVIAILVIYFILFISMFALAY